MPALTDTDHDRIAVLVAEKIAEKNREMWVDRETHYQHHNWIDRKISDDETARQFKRKVVQSVAIWAVILLVGFAATWMWQGFVDTVHKGVP